MLCVFVFLIRAWNEFINQSPWSHSFRISGKNNVDRRFIYDRSRSPVQLHWGKKIKWVQEEQESKDKQQKDHLRPEINEVQN